MQTTFTRAQIRQMAEAREIKPRGGVVVELEAADPLRNRGIEGDFRAVVFEARDESQLVRDMRGPEISTVTQSRKLTGLGSFSPDREVVLKKDRARGREKRDDGRRYLGSLMPSEYNATLGCWVLGRRRP